MSRIPRLLFSFVMAGLFLSSCHPTLYRMSYRPEANMGDMSTTSKKWTQSIEKLPNPNSKPIQIVRPSDPMDESIHKIEFHSTEQQFSREKPKAKKSKGPSKSWKESLGLSKTTKKPTKKERRPLFRPNNDGLWIGGGLLGIAMLLTILNFPSLALLFGLVSLLFFIFAIKKIVRRNRRRQRFKARQRN